MTLMMISLIIFAESLSGPGYFPNFENSRCDKKYNNWLKSKLVEDIE